MKRFIGERWPDLVPALVILAFGSADVEHQDHLSLGAAIAALAISGVLVGLRRRAPILTLAALLAIQAVTPAPSKADDPGYYFLAAQLMLFTVGYQSPLRPALGALAGACVFFVAYNVLRDGNQVDAVLGSVLWAVAFGFGVAARRALDRGRALETEPQRTAAALDAERARIARELHDAVAHAVSVMVLQTGAVRRRLAPEQEREREALDAVERTGREAATELRRMLGFLRPDENDTRTPRPTLERLDELAEAMRHAGLPVEVRTEGEPRPLPAGIDAALYRIVQAALTNSLEHAGPGARAQVCVAYGRNRIVAEVVDDGRGPRDGAKGPGRGNGLIGMQERATLYGGSLDAGAADGGGFRVRATLPLAEVGA